MLYIADTSIIGGTPALIACSVPLMEQQSKEPKNCSRGDRGVWVCPNQDACRRHLDGHHSVAPQQLAPRTGLVKHAQAMSSRQLPLRADKKLVKGFRFEHVRRAAGSCWKRSPFTESINVNGDSALWPALSRIGVDSIALDRKGESLGDAILARLVDLKGWKGGRGQMRALTQVALFWSSDLCVALPHSGRSPECQLLHHRGRCCNEHACRTAVPGMNLAPAF